MLIPISQLSQDDYLRAVLRGHLVAVDPDSGAQLSVSHGRTSKAPKYILILPNKTVAERGGLITPADWDYPDGRKFLRAWTDKEAIEIAKVKLAKMLAANAAFVFRCSGGKCHCRRRAEVSVDAGGITVWIQGDGADVADVYGPQLLANDLADGELVIENAAGYGSIEVNEPTAANLRNWLFHRGIVLPEPEPRLEEMPRDRSAT